IKPGCSFRKISFLSWASENKAINISDSFSVNGINFRRYAFSSSTLLSGIRSFNTTGNVLIGIENHSLLQNLCLGINKENINGLSISSFICFYKLKVTYK